MEEDKILEAYDKMIEDNNKMLKEKEEKINEGKIKDFVIQSQRHVEDALSSIKEFIEEGKLNKKHKINLQQLLQDLSKIKE